MRVFLHNMWVRCFLYTLFCVFVFASTNLLLGWLMRDYNWLYSDARVSIFLFVVLNIFIDLVVITITNNQN